MVLNFFFFLFKQNHITANSIRQWRCRLRQGRYRCQSGLRRADLLIPAAQQNKIINSRRCCWWRRWVQRLLLHGSRAVFSSTELDSLLVCSSSTSSQSVVGMTWLNRCTNKQSPGWWSGNPIHKFADVFGRKVGINFECITAVASLQNDVVVVDDDDDDGHGDSLKLRCENIKPAALFGAATPVELEPALKSEQFEIQAKVSKPVSALGENRAGKKKLYPFIQFLTLCYSEKWDNFKWINSSTTLPHNAHCLADANIFLSYFVQMLIHDANSESRRCSR